jgi:hypothetical protein
MQGHRLSGAMVMGDTGVAMASFEKQWLELLATKPV